MAWIYLAESEDSVSLSTNGSNPSPTAKSIPIVKESSCPELRLVNSRMLPYGMILKHWTGLNSHGDMSISYLEASRARTLALQDAEKAWKESEAGYFSRSCAWPKKSSPNLYSLKTCRPLGIAEAFELLPRLPSWGMTVDGVCYPLHPLERYISVRDGSYWATPNTMDGMGLRSTEALKRQFMTSRKGRTKPANLRDQVHPQCYPHNLFASPSNHEDTGERLCPIFVECLMAYPCEWTVLESWAIAWYQSKRKRRSKS